MGTINGRHTGAKRFRARRPSGYDNRIHGACKREAGSSRKPAALMEDLKPEHGAIAGDEFVGSEYQSRPQDGKDAFRVLKWMIGITQTKAELLVLAQCAYWFGVSSKGGVGVRAKVEFQGHRWVYKTHAHLGRETCLTRDQARAAVRRLTQAGILVVNRDHPDHAVLYRLSATSIRDAVHAHECTSVTTVEEDGDEFN